MKRISILFLLLALTFLISCEPVKTDVVPEDNVSTDIVSNSNGSNVINLPVSVDEKNMEKSLDNVVWINPGKVYISNLFPGSQAEWVLKIHNEKADPVTFSVYYKSPDYVEKGYEKLPDKFAKWVVTNKSIVVAPNSIGETIITIKMDKNDQAYAKKYEVWIAVMDDTQAGMIRTELCSRWFISTQ